MEYSLLYPKGMGSGFKAMTDVTWHDLGFDVIVKSLSPKASEQVIITKIMTHMTADPDIARYRAEVFKDIMDHPELRERMTELLEHINHLVDFGSMRRTSVDGPASIWDLMHRLDDIHDYIVSVEAIHECLNDADISSHGLIGLREYADSLYHDHGFDALKKDIDDLRATTSSLKSVTLGVNLNERFEADSLGLISINSKPFTKAPLLSNFSGAILRKDMIHKEAEWNGDYDYHPIDNEDLKREVDLNRAAALKTFMNNPLMTIGMSNVSQNDTTLDMPRYMDRIVNHMLYQTTRKLREVLDRYVTMSVYDFTALIPEFMYYIRWAEYIERSTKAGHWFTAPVVRTAADGDDTSTMKAAGIYNLKLIGEVKATQIVANEVFFDDEHALYLLTGANRGGKTTITQAVGQTYVMAQGGIYIPGTKYEYQPVDCIYTHFPADEDKTMDLGRLGEECRRFKDLFTQCTPDSLLLLNETFATTSFEEGYYIAKDAARAILSRGTRTIFNTHMHKLAYDVDIINEGSGRYKAASMIVSTKNGVRSYRVEIAPPEGSSYADDIARKYGVTYEQLIEQ